MLLEEQGLSRSDLARHLQVEPSTVSRYTSGRVPEAATLNKVAEYFGVTTDFLLGRTEMRRAEETPPANDDNADRLVVIFRGRPQKLSKEYERLIIKMIEAEGEAESKKDQP